MPGRPCYGEPGGGRLLALSTRSACAGIGSGRHGVLVWRRVPRESNRQRRTIRSARAHRGVAFVPHRHSRARHEPRQRAFRRRPCQRPRAVRAWPGARRVTCSRDGARHGGARDSACANRVGRGRIAPERDGARTSEASTTPPTAVASTTRYPPEPHASERASPSARRPISPARSRMPFQLDLGSATEFGDAILGYRTSAECSRFTPKG